MESPNHPNAPHPHRRHSRTDRDILITLREFTIHHSFSLVIDGISVSADVVILESGMRAFTNGNATASILTFESIPGCNQVAL
jgi:hypothetical protein